MIYFLALIPATALTAAGYCVLYLAQRSEGNFRSFGKYLGFWAFSLAALVILGAIFAAAHGERYGAMHAHPWHGMMHRPWAERPRFPGPDFGAAPDGSQPPKPQSGGVPPASAAPAAPPNPSR